MFWNSWFQRRFEKTYVLYSLDLAFSSLHKPECTARIHSLKAYSHILSENSFVHTQKGSYKRLIWPSKRGLILDFATSFVKFGAQLNFTKKLKAKIERSFQIEGSLNNNCTNK